MTAAARPEHLSEDQVIALVAELAGPPPKDLPQGIGDDCAVLAVPYQRQVVTTDLLVEGVHFRLDWIGPQAVGHRAMAANLSDLASMGAKPRWGFLSLGLPAPARASLVEPLVSGMLELGRRHGLYLAGGDTVKSPQIIINLALIGELAEGGPLLRSRARPGEAVCVTGRLGRAAAGLAWLAGGNDPAAGAAADLVAAHASPQPRVAAGRALAASGRVSAMMDLSDGLASDLARLAVASGCGAQVEAARLPIDAATKEMARRLAADPLQWAVAGGEDFELLFTCRPQEVGHLTAVVAAAEGGLDVTPIGTMVDGSGLLLKTRQGARDISGRGYDHFRRREES